MNLTTMKSGVIVVGAGHAGIEASLAAARMGVPTLMLTLNLDHIGQMSCNPAIGGIGKGHLVREIDALGGEMALAIDETGIQFRFLNTRKGPAVRARRAQADKAAYRARMKRVLEITPNLTIRQASVERLLVEGGRVRGVESQIGEIFEADCVILTTGTFLKGLVHIGLKNYSAGRAGDFAAMGLSEHLAELGFRIGRLKTGTCPRLDSRSIDYSELEVQPGDDPPPPFSFRTPRIEQDQIACHLTYTNALTHEIIRGGIDRSPMYSGVIQSRGPRYCPSVEDKVMRFRDKERHQIFLEPEGRDTMEVYPNGLSTSLPLDVQLAMVRSIKGLEHAEIMRPGYAIEYDFSDPTQLQPSLETKLVDGLFFAGQLNGTTGYEEAGAQGLMAGINAALKVRDESPLILRRDEAYIGVMIDDLVTRGIGGEPYRMFTSRAEYRLLLREDNADRRLTPIGERLGLLGAAAGERLRTKDERVKARGRATFRGARCGERCSQRDTARMRLDADCPSGARLRVTEAAGSLVCGGARDGGSDAESRFRRGGAARNRRQIRGLRQAAGRDGRPLQAPGGRNHPAVGRLRGGERPLHRGSRAAAQRAAAIARTGGADARDDAGGDFANRVPS